MLWQEKDTLETKRKVFMDILLPQHPPVFYEWFIGKFTNSENWYRARTSYIRTTAVMSMVGYILGLGDRHCENILFDSTNGDTTHVDYNCLFNKGEKAPYPELIPFRLTQNMVHAMGPLGVEGMHRKSCEITLKILHQQMRILMSVVKPFLNDSLVEWRDEGSTNTSTTTEKTILQVLNNVRRLDERLQLLFINDASRNISNSELSVESVVEQCIKQAMDIDRLPSMYHGWAAYL